MFAENVLEPGSAVDTDDNPSYAGVDRALEHQNFQEFAIKSRNCCLLKITLEREEKMAINKNNYKDTPLMKQSKIMLSPPPPTKLATLLPAAVMSAVVDHAGTTIWSISEAVRGSRILGNSSKQITGWFNSLLPNMGSTIVANLKIKTRDWLDIVSLGVANDGTRRTSHDDERTFAWIKDDSKLGGDRVERQGTGKQFVSFCNKSGMCTGGQTPSSTVWSIPTDETTSRFVKHTGIFTIRVWSNVCQAAISICVSARGNISARISDFALKASSYLISERSAVSEQFYIE